VCALANVLGREVCKLHELHKHGKMEEAKLLQHKLILPNTAVSELCRTCIRLLVNDHLRECS